MKPKGPLVTLAVGAVLAAGLLVANLSLSRSVTTATATGTTAAPTRTTPPPASASSSSVSGSESAPPSATDVAVVATEATYAGKVVGGGSLSVAVKGASAVAYLCDGRNEAWLWGTVAGTKVTLKNPKGDTLTAVRGGGRLTGSLTVNGRTWAFALPTVAKPSGVYRATARIRGAKIVAGWVVLPDGSQVGAWTSDGGPVTPAPPIDVTSGAVTLAGTALTALPADPATTAAS